MAGGESQSVGRCISSLYRHLMAFLDEKLKPLGLSSGLFSFMMALYKHAPIKQEQLVRLINIDKSTASRAIKKLENGGFITRKKESSDRRTFVLVLTGKGKSIKQQLKDISRAFTRRAFEGFSAGERELVTRLLERMERNVSGNAGHP